MNHNYMSFKYIWKNREANFGSPVEIEVPGGTHVSADTSGELSKNLLTVADGLDQHFDTTLHKF